MKTILIPTDFSEDARNAADYGVQLAKFSNANTVRTILFHAYQVPVSLGEEQINMMLTIDEFEKETNRQMKIEANRLLLKWGGQPICQISMGFTVEEIVNKSIENNADLIVMGTHGGNRLEELFFGNNTTEVIHKSEIPVLAIPHNAKFSKPEKIVFAYDYHEVTSKGLKLFKSFFNLFHTQFFVLHFLKELELPTSEMAIEGIKTENQLADIDHSYHFLINKDIEKGINNFVDKNNADMIAMIPHQNSLLKRIFSRSITDKMAFHTHIPLLTLAAGKGE